MSVIDFCKGEFMILEDCVDQLPGVIVMQLQERRKAGIDRGIPSLVNAENIHGVPFPILVIKLSLPDGSAFTYIPNQTIIPNPKFTGLFIIKIGFLEQKDLVSDSGFLLLPGWVLNWQGKDNIYNLRFNCFLHYFRDDASRNLGGPQSAQSNPVHLVSVPMQLDQEQQQSHYKFLLPRICVVLSGNAPQQLHNNRLLVTFAKSANAEVISIPFSNRQITHQIQQHKIEELLDIKREALEMTTQVYISRQNIHHIKSGVQLRTLRKSLSSNGRFPHLLSSLEAGLDAIELITMRNLSPQIACDYSYIPCQVIIMERASNLRIYYIGLVSSIHVDSDTNRLHLPGISIIIDDPSKYTIEIDLKLMYTEDSDRIVICKHQSAACAVSSAHHLSKMPAEHLLLEGVKPVILGSIAINVTLAGKGQLCYYKCVSSHDRLPPPILTGGPAHAREEPGLETAIASGIQTLTLHQSGMSASNKNPPDQRNFAHGRFIFPNESQLNMSQAAFKYRWNVVPRGNHLEPLPHGISPQYSPPLCIELTFSDRSTFIYLPVQHRVYVNEQKLIYKLGHFHLYDNSEGDILIAGETVKKLDDGFEMVLNPHYKVTTLGNIEKLEDIPVINNGFIDNFYLTPPPESEIYLSGALPAGVLFENITVGFPTITHFTKITAQRGADAGGHYWQLMHSQQGATSGARMEQDRSLQV